MTGRNTLGILELQSNGLSKSALAEAVAAGFARHGTSFPNLFTVYDPRGRCYHQLQALCISAHIFEVASNAPSATIIDSMAKVPMDALRPWELWLVRGARDRLVIKIPHSIIDGTGCISFIQNILSDAASSPAVPEPRPPVRARRFEVVNVLRATARLLQDTVRPAIPHLALRKRGQRLPSLDAFYAALSPATEAPQTMTFKLPLATLQAVARCHGATVSHVLVAALGGALRSELLRHHDEATVRALDLFTRVPANARQGPQTSGNLMTADLVAICLPLRLDVSSDADRLRHVTAAGPAVQRGADIAVRRFCREAVLAAVPTSVLERLPLQKRWSWSCPMYTSSLKGPPTRLTIAGRKLDSFFYFSSDLTYANAHMIEVVAVSYEGQMQVALRTLLGPDFDLRRFQSALAASVAALAATAELRP
ncbi:hypothetical protein ACHHYP_08694 [Achlya hypogyna]|uniref:Uncharacterized protein n=1 Tax=Achlya hypogyna TaxID=1202772 RepID=A0A1V9YPE0_ACHHY|nr:hypothetical protein ACHHYP_08694 [Achlya hypogyna]